MMNFKFLLKLFCLISLVLITGCANYIAEAKRKEKDRLFINSITTPIEPIVTAFEKICLNNETSPEGMIKAAKTYNIGEINTSNYKIKKLIGPFKYETLTGTQTTIKTLDGKMRFRIYNPLLECEVDTLSGNNAVVDVLLSSPDYRDDKKTMDIHLGMMLFKKYGNSIKVSSMGKANSGNTYYSGPAYSRFDGEKEVRYFLKPGSNSVSIKLTEDAD